MLDVIKHHFVGGVYAKEMRIPDGFEVVSHKHLFDHMSVLTQGCVIVEADGIQETYYAPAVIGIKAGVAHSVLPVNGDAHWLCIHATDCTDETKVDEVLIGPVKHMEKTELTFKVDSAIQELELHPELWNQYRMRTESENSPHREVDDIWLRYKDPRLPIDQQKPHDSVWYNSIRQLPAIRTIIEKIMLAMPKGAELGGALITKIAPECQVYPHSDAGTWHSEYYNSKVLVLLQSAPGQSFNFTDESHEGVAGEVFTFDNMPEHGVVNNSDIDRISLIIAIRTLPDEPSQT